MARRGHSKLFTSNSAGFARPATPQTGCPASARAALWRPVARGRTVSCDMGAYWYADALPCTASDSMYCTSCFMSVALAAPARARACPSARRPSPPPRPTVCGPPTAPRARPARLPSAAGPGAGRPARRVRTPRAPTQPSSARNHRMCLASCAEGTARAREQLPLSQRREHGSTTHQSLARRCILSMCDCCARSQSVWRSVSDTARSTAAEHPDPVTALLPSRHIGRRRHAASTGAHQTAQCPG